MGRVAYTGRSCLLGIVMWKVTISGEKRGKEWRGEEDEEKWVRKDEGHEVGEER